MLRVSPCLDDDTEALIHRVIGCCIQVHRELGPGLLEGVYRRAVCGSPVSRSKLRSACSSHIADSCFATNAWTSLFAAESCWNSSP